MKQINAMKGGESAGSSAPQLPQSGDNYSGNSGSVKDACVYGSVTGKRNVDCAQTKMITNVNTGLIQYATFNGKRNQMVIIPLNSIIILD